MSDHPTAAPMPEAIVLREWPWPNDPVRYFRARTAYVERLWLPMLGPGALVLLRFLVEVLEIHGDGAVLETSTLSVALGFGSRTQPGAHSRLDRALRRLERFGFAHRAAGEVKVRGELPVLDERDLSRLPAVLRERHDRALGTE